ARDRPDRRIVHALEPVHAIKPGQRIARRELAPADGEITVKGNKARRRAAPDEPSQRLPVLITPAAIGAADPPIHAPAAVARAPLAEEIFERRPQLRRERNDFERLCHRGVTISAQLDTGFLHHLAPALHLILDEGAELVRRGRLCLDIELLEAPLDFWRGD